MPLDPLERGLHLQFIPLFYLGQYGLNEIFVLDCLPGRSPPPIPPPILIPAGNTVNGVSAVGNDDHTTVSWNDLESSKDRG